MLDCGEFDCEYCSKDKCIYMMDNNAEREVQKMNLDKITDDELEKMYEEITNERNCRKKQAKEKALHKINSLLEEMKQIQDKYGLTIILERLGEDILLDDISYADEY